MWGIDLQRESEVPLKRQLYLALRERILSGRMKAGEALPSTRELAGAIRVSRNTVNEAYEMLAVEGFVMNRQGAATRVAEGLVLERTPASEAPEDDPQPASYAADFRTGQPDLRQFPRYLWQQMTNKALREMPAACLGYSGPQGLARLCEEIAAYLLRSKGLSVAADHIFITAGATYALNLIARPAV